MMKKLFLGLCLIGGMGLLHAADSGKVGTMIAPEHETALFEIPSSKTTAM
jgi:hypothetical protein